MSSLKLYYAKRAERLALQAKVNIMEQDEKDLLYSITKEMHDNDSLTMEQEGFRALRTVKIAANVTNWPALLNYIKETGSVDLLQKRVTESAVKLRWADGKVLPGVDKTSKDSIDVTPLV